MLVNKARAVPEDYETDLISLNDGKNNVSSVIYADLMKMLEAGKNRDIPLP